MKYIMLTLACFAPTAAFSACPTPTSGNIDTPTDVVFLAGQTEKQFNNLTIPPFSFTTAQLLCNMTTTYLRGPTSGDYGLPAPGVYWLLFHNVKKAGTPYAFGQYYTSPATRMHWNSLGITMINMRIFLDRPYSGATQIPAGPVGSYEILDSNNFSRGVATLSIANPIRLNVVGCALTTLDQAIDLGTVSASEFAGVGSTAGPKRDAAFTLDCGNVQTDTTVQLTGTQDPGGTGILGLTPGSRAATGVGVQLSVDGAVTPLGADTRLGVLPPGLTKFTVSAQYIRTAAGITAGDANASATINVTHR